jgi:hypothetical protein
MYFHINLSVFKYIYIVFWVYTCINNGAFWLLILTPKIPCVVLPNSAVSDIVGKINFSKNKSMRI